MKWNLLNQETLYQSISLISFEPLWEDESHFLTKHCERCTTIISNIGVWSRLFELIYCTLT